MPPRIQMSSPGWGHRHSIGAATTDADVLKATGAVANVAATETGAAGTCGSVGCTAAHPASVVAQRANVVQASGAAKVAAVTAIPNQTGVAQ